MSSKRLRFGIDSSCLIPLLSEWHDHHQATLSCYQRLLSDGATPIVPVNAILETFSVLTRLPPPRRLEPEIAAKILDQTFSQTAVIAEMTAEIVWSVMSHLSRLGLGGGRIYDGAIAHCAARAGATVLLTWNAKHFVPIAPAGLEVLEPNSVSR